MDQLFALPPPLPGLDHFDRVWRWVQLLQDHANGTSRIGTAGLLESTVRQSMARHQGIEQAFGVEWTRPDGPSNRATYVGLAWWWSPVGALHGRIRAERTRRRPHQTYHPLSGPFEGLAPICAVYPQLRPLIPAHHDYSQRAHWPELHRFSDPVYWNPTDWIARAIYADWLDDQPDGLDLAGVPIQEVRGRARLAEQLLRQLLGEIPPAV